MMSYRVDELARIFSDTVLHAHLSTENLSSMKSESGICGYSWVQCESHSDCFLIRATFERGSAHASACFDAFNPTRFQDLQFLLLPRSISHEHAKPNQHWLQNDSNTSLKMFAPIALSSFASDTCGQGSKAESESPVLLHPNTDPKGKGECKGEGEGKGEGRGQGNGKGEVEGRALEGEVKGKGEGEDEGSGRAEDKGSGRALDAGGKRKGNGEVNGNGKGEDEGESMLNVANEGHGNGLGKYNCEGEGGVRETRVLQEVSFFIISCRCSDYFRLATFGSN